MRKKTSIKMIRNLIIFILLILVTFWLIFKDQDLTKLFETIKSAKISYLIIGAMIMLCYHLTEAYNIRSLIYCLGERKISIIKALKFTLIGFFFSSITPAATGGQPIEIYYMTKENISGPRATMSSLIMLCGFQISTISFGVICAIIYPSLLKGSLFWLFLLGLTINLTGLIMLFICIFSKKLTRKIINSIIKSLQKLRIKSIEKRKKSLEENLKKYNESAEFIKKHKKEFIKAILRGFLQIAFYYSVPFCIYKSLGLSSHSYFQIFAMQAVLYTTVSGLPLPGAVGISETVFLTIFRSAFGKSLIGASMLLSRGVTFYLYVVISFVVVVVNAIRMKNVKGEIDKAVIEIEQEVKEIKQTTVVAQ